MQHTLQSTGAWHYGGCQSVTDMRILLILRCHDDDCHDSGDDDDDDGDDDDEGDGDNGLQANSLHDNEEYDDDAINALVDCNDSKDG